MNVESTFRKYAPFWSKYRPAILKMMQASPNEWQQYQFMKHELSAVEKKPRGGFNFRMVISMSRATIDSRDSEIAKDLVNMLQMSQTGAALIAANRYEVILDKNQVLRINKQGIEQQ
jgi:hypothetical protein